MARISPSWSTRRIAYVAMLTALSIVGANLKIPSLTGTPALDSFPGFLGALLLGPMDGGLIAFLGHLLTALTAGFPLTLPLHLLIAVGMGGIASLFAFLCRYSWWFGGACGICLNSIVLPGIVALLPGFGKAFFLAMLLPLLVASTLNIALALMVFKSLGKIFPDSYIGLQRKGGTP